MKYLLTASLLAFSLVVFGQTTMEEYNYLTKGYKIQQESGLDMKRGYELIHHGKFIGQITQGFSSKNAGAEFQFLYREGEKTPCAVLMILHEDGKPDGYLCIPDLLSDQAVWDKAEERFKQLSGYASFGYTWGMVRMISSMASGMAERPATGSAKAYGPDGH